MKEFLIHIPYLQQNPDNMSLKKKAIIFLFFCLVNEIYSQEHKATVFPTWQFDVAVDTMAMPELKIVNEDLLIILDSMALKIHQCEALPTPYRFIITHRWKQDSSIGNFEIFGFQQAFFSDAEPKGVGYFYHKDVFYVVKDDSQSLPDCFEKTTRETNFITYCDIPPMAWEPVEWVYSKWNGKFYFLYYGWGLCY